MAKYKHKICTRVKSNFFATNFADHSRDHLALKADVSSEISVNELAERIIEEYGEPPSIVVHAAGILPPAGGLERCTTEQWDATISVNLRGTFLVNKKFVSLMKEYSLKGAVVNVASIAAQGAKYLPDYAASKAGTIAFTKSIAKEAAAYNVRVNVIAPGFIDTPMVQKLGDVAEKIRDEEVPMKRFGHPQEVAELCLFLVSEKSSFCTGGLYQIDGGLTI